MNSTLLGQDERYQGLETLLDVIGLIIEDLMKHGETQPPIMNPSTRDFNCIQPCQYPIRSYLHRLATHSGISNECFILILIYLDRLVSSNKIHLTRFNVHRVVITAALVAAKFFDDQFYFNPYFETIGGLFPREINKLEVHFLFLLKFKLHVTREEYETFYLTLVKSAVNRNLIDQPGRWPAPLEILGPLEKYEEPETDFEPIPLFFPTPDGVNTEAKNMQNGTNTSYEGVQMPDSRPSFNDLNDVELMNMLTRNMTNMKLDLSSQNQGYGVRIPGQVDYLTRAHTEPYFSAAQYNAHRYGTCSTTTHNANVNINLNQGVNMKIKPDLVKAMSMQPELESKYINQQRECGNVYLEHKITFNSYNNCIGSNFVSSGSNNCKVVNPVLMGRKSQVSNCSKYDIDCNFFKGSRVQNRNYFYN